MRAVVLEIDERMLAERSRLGLDHRDEMWEGVLHVIPPPFQRHGRIQLALGAALLPVAQRRGLVAGTEVGIYRSDEDYRVADLCVWGLDASADRGVDGAPVVVIEIRSPNDESDAKVPWYLARGAKAVLVVDRDTLALDLHTPDGHTTGDLVLKPLGVRISRTADSLAVDGVELDL